MFRLISETTLFLCRVIANYLMWRAVFSVTDYLHAEVLDRQLHYETALWGMRERQSRWRDCVRFTNYNQRASTPVYWISPLFESDTSATNGGPPELKVT